MRCRLPRRCARTVSVRDGRMSVVIGLCKVEVASGLPACIPVFGLRLPQRGSAYVTHTSYLVEVCSICTADSSI